MMAIAQALVIFLSVVSSVRPGSVPTLQWPDGYTASGSIVLPYAEINEDFVAYVDLTGKMGRIDSYGGQSVNVIYI